MRITDAMRAYAKAKGWVEANATDDQIKAAISAKLISGDLTSEQFGDLAANKEPGKAGNPDAKTIIATMIDERFKGLEDRLGGRIADLLKGSDDEAAKKAKAEAEKKAQEEAAQKAKEDADKALEEQAKRLAARMGVTLPDAGAGEDKRLTPTQLLSRAETSSWAVSPSVRVKSAIERYGHTKSNLIYPSEYKIADLRGRQVTFPCEDGPGMGRPLEAVSQRDKAIIGSWFKFALMAGGNDSAFKGAKMNEEDWDLLKYALHELPWTGVLGHEEHGTPVNNQRLSEVFHKGVSGIRAILDDSTSGGIYAAPQIVEDAIIQTPLLYGELFPFVTVTTIARGRRITGPTMGTPTLTWGTAEGTEIGLFDTTGFIGSLDTTIFPVVGAMEIGLDFEEDSPANIGALVVVRYGQAFLQSLDFVVADGDGTTQPKGIFQTSGATVVPSANGDVGPLVVSDAEALMFGVNKAYRTTRGGRNVLIGNETSYRRLRQIPVGADNATRFFGENYADYTVLGHPFKIITSLTNNELAYANLGYYLMYRRLGMTVKIETSGKELSRKHLKLILIRARYGGQVEQAGAVSLMSDAAD